MKKIKWYLAVVAMLAIGSAFTTATPKSVDTVYYFDGSEFHVKDPGAELVSFLLPYSAPIPTIVKTRITSQIPARKKVTTMLSQMIPEFGHHSRSSIIKGLDLFQLSFFKCEYN